MNWIALKDAPKDCAFAVCVVGGPILAELYSWCEGCQAFHGVFSKTPLVLLQTFMENEVLMCLPVLPPGVATASSAVN